MKKKLILAFAVMAILVCALTLCVSAADKIVPSSSNEYGELTTFDESIGRTDISPNKADGNVARTVLFDGTSYYTVPTIYLTSKNSYETDILLQFSFSAINSKLGKSFDKKSVIRCELPADIVYLGGDNQNFNGFTNIIEIKLNGGLRFAGNSTYKAFANCKKITELDISMMVLEYPNSTYSLFEYCDLLQTVKLPNAYVKADGTVIDYSTDYMFNGCKSLTTINNLYGLMSGTTRINQKMFNGCNQLENIKIWGGVSSIGSEALRGTKIKSIVIPDTVTSLPNHVFADCKSLEKVVLPTTLTSVGNYCFEKCTAFTAVWMPSSATTFNTQVFGQIGASRDVKFYFPTSTSLITFASNSNNNDPLMNALNNESDSRLIYNAPLSTKCTVFLGGHDLSGEGVYGFSGESYVSDFEKVTCCARGCGEQITETICAPLFENKGYSAAEYEGGGMSIGFKVNKAAILAYEEITGETVNYGVFAVLAEKIGANDIFDSEGKALAGVIAADITDTDFDIFNLKIVGFTDKQLDIDLAMGAYVGVSKDGATEYAYLQDVTAEKNDKYYFASYNDVKAILDNKNGVSAQ